MQISNIYPESFLPPGWAASQTLTHQYFQFELISTNWWLESMKSRPYVAIYASVAYLVTIFGLQGYMKDKPAYSLRIPLFIWNLSIGIFSFACFIRYIPALIEVFSEPDAFYKSICTREHMTVPMVYWSILFALSKFIELGDTVFLALRKKPVVFLQWYHHLATMSAAWILSPLMEPVQRWFVFMNTGVHSLMYPYFAFKGLGMKIPRKFGNVITTIQLAQMVFGMFVNGLSMYYYEAGQDCYRHPLSIKFFAVLYGSFLFLFGKLFYDLVINGQSSTKTKTKKLE